ncbi:hypothetical protein EC991_008824 [Linnemannia zychae]|nr:hypothetical protein EC991_008824 [Linnemannia zychae]
MFDFETQSDYYEFLHDKIQEMLHERLMRDFDFVKIPVPWDPSSTISESQDPIPANCPQVFASRDIFVNPKVLIIVQGLGKVAPGQWARKLFTNGRKGEFDYASQFPYIKRALHLGWAIILCDPNRTEMSGSSGSGVMQWLGGRGGSRSDHVRRVWEDLVRYSAAKCVMFVAFSAGTRATLDLFDSYRKEFMRRVKAVVLLDGATGSEKYRQRDGAWLFKNTRSFSQMGAKRCENGDVVNTNDHDSVPGEAVGEVFAFLEERHNHFMAQLPEEEYSRIRGAFRRVGATKDVASWEQPRIFRNSRR